jgi:hypothetical protein
MNLKLYCSAPWGSYDYALLKCQFFTMFICLVMNIAPFFSNFYNQVRTMELILR